ncbi:AAA family ATPase [Clostridium tyrobutyricum]|uniref:AAA family ATPase n=1 Tax=Clostridium tyrobutyricum TaxID=1519 RepID=UPI001C37E787|nr:AAA family ATPase [Clostridium tyrobutyricum]MBV4420175.1 AAA family ATPase [Clostridium tyrobutyricum]
MKILYMWIKEYGCIKEQGFLTNSEYDIRVNLEKDNNEDKFTLYIKKNENYIKDFFNIERCPNYNIKITDITAIIGENGAGKSTLLNFIKDNLVNVGEMQIPAIIIIKDGENKVIYYHESIKMNFKVDKSFTEFKYSDKPNFKYLNDNRNTSFIFYSNVFDYSKLESEWGENYNISTNYLINHDKKQGLEMKYFNTYYSEVDIFRHNEIKRQLDFVSNYKDNVQFKFKLPDSVYISINPIMLEKPIKENMNKDKIKLLPLMQYVNKELTDYKNRCNSIKDVLKCNFYTAIFNSFFYNYDLCLNPVLSLDDINRSAEVINNKQETIYFGTKEFENNDIFYKIKKFFENILNCCKKNKPNYDIKWVESIIKVRGFIENAINNEYISSNCIVLSVDISKFSIFNFIKLYDKSFSFRPFLNFDWRDMSSGEKAQLTMFSRLFYIAKKEDIIKLKNDMILLIDEGELYYHPQWQKEFIKTMIYLLKDIYKNTSIKEIQVILTSNSPFIASDIPTRNIIFITKENQNCKVMNGLEENIYTFGANIHTLLSDSFFIRDGLIGSFVKQKINNLIKSLINDSDEDLQRKSKEINYMIAMIGEPIIRNKLQKIFRDRIYNLTKNEILYNDLIEKIDGITKEIKELKKRNTN